MRNSNHRGFICLGLATVTAAVIVIASPSTTLARGGGRGGHGGSVGAHYRALGSRSFRNLGIANRGVAPFGSPVFSRFGGVSPFGGFSPFGGTAIVPPFSATALSGTAVSPETWEWNGAAWHRGGFYRGFGNQPFNGYGLPFYDYGFPFLDYPIFGEEPVVPPVYTAPPVPVVEVWHPDEPVWHRRPGAPQPQVWHRDKDGNWHEVTGGTD